MKSMYQRQFIVMMVVILLSFALLGTSFAVLSYRQTIQSKRSSLERNAGFISEFTSAAIAQGISVDNAYIQSYIASIGHVTDSGVVVTQLSGEVLYASNTELVGRQVSSQAVEQVLESGSYEAIDTLDIMSERCYVFGTAVTVSTLDGSTPVLLVFVGMSTGELVDIWRPLFVLFVFITLIVILITFIVSSVTAAYQSRPLKQMVAATRKFAHGEFDVRVDGEGRRDEIGELAVSFNAMAEALAASEDRRSEFIANVSHELKTPMTTIAGFSDGILDGTIPPERQEDALRTISSETRRLSRLVRRMLDLSRLQMTEEVVAQKPFDIVEVMARVLVSLETKINDKALEVDARFPPEPLMVWGDADDITQVGYNLLENAIKFARQGGTLRVVVTDARGPKASVTVGDQGDEIPQEELSLIFDRFHKTDHSRSVDRDGVGLGLYIVKTILNNHKEDITVTSQDGWTEFTFTLTKV
ncbi:MAG: HAMP domain-containing histidine kinase [Oscillospiraceae bacterium]|nr:HAMP domain-containing histidine kinase [Oscillospiraceae bacterium]